MRRRAAITLEERLGALPQAGLPLKARVAVHWDGHHIPFIEAENDADLAVALGVVHVHLRWGQMEIMRRIALGRLSEMIGPAGVKFDHALRILGLARIAAATAAMLPMETAQWIENYVNGINHAIERAPELPPEFRVLGIGREQWRSEDVLALGRLVAADITWLTLIPILRERDKTLASALWRRIVGAEGAHAGTSSTTQRSRIAPALIQGFCWTGCSNSVAVAPSRSASGAPCLASDPHLPVTVPNPFLIAGYRSPSFHVVGLMAPGLPFVALGRNPRIAWGGTNLHAASSDLFDVSDLRPKSIAERDERIRVRWWGDRTLTIRECAYGPVISDLAILGQARRGDFALRWVGSIPSDEITAMLRVNRARDWSEFRAALDSFAVPGQNLIYADVEGHIGKAIAARLPRRPPTPPAEPILPGPAAIHWQSFVTSSDLPASFDPADGFVASANEKPSGTRFPIGYVFSSNSRIERLIRLLGSRPRHSLGDLADIQRDALAPGALQFRDDLVRRLRPIMMPGDRPAYQLIREIEDWDGRYAMGSRGALAFELFVFFLIRALSGRNRLALYAASWSPWDLMRVDIATAAPDLLAKAARKAASACARKLRKYRVWGDVHRLRLRHFAGVFPVVGRRFRLGDWPVAGGSETILKTEHPLTDRRHCVRLAASARHISDLSDSDRNYFVLLGGQDGWLGSTTTLDQVPMWQTGSYIQVPLTIDAVRRTLPIHMELMP